MYRIVVKSNQIVIINRQLSNDECLLIPGTGAQWVLSVVKKYINIDVSDYRLNEYESRTGFFILHIRSEDISKLREDKLSKLLG